MILIFLFYVLITATCLWTGYYGCYFLQKLLPSNHGKSVAIYLLWGMVMTTLVGELAALFGPVNQLVWLVWALLLGLISAANKKLSVQYLHWLKNTYRRNTHLLIPAGVIVLLVSVLGAGPLMMDDTESYHIQAIKWIQEWGTVPGLVNLHERYGFNTGWFTWAAFFIPTHTAHNYYSVANGVLSCWIGVYVYSMAFPSRQLEKRGRSTSLAAFFVLLIALVCWPMIRGNATTANYDFITTCMLLTGLLEWMRLTCAEQHWKALLPEMLVWPAFLFTVRIINFPVLLFSLFASIHLLRSKAYALLSTCLLMAMVLVGAFLARNVLLSGFLFYPAYQIDLFQVDWKADLLQTKELVYFIKYYNRISNEFMPIRETAKLSLGQWLPLWFRYLTWTDKMLVVLSLTGYAAMLWRRKGIPGISFPSTIFVAIMLLQLGAWFLVAPDPRFVYGPLLVGVFLLFYSAPINRLQPRYTSYQHVLQALLLLGLLAYTGAKVLRKDSYRHVLQPIEVPQPVTHTVLIDAIPLQIPEKLGNNWNPRCYATGLPCLYELHPRLHARGKGIGAGFMLR